MGFVMGLVIGVIMTVGAICFAQGSDCELEDE